MYMISHQTVRVDLDPECVFKLTQIVQITLKITSLRKHNLTIVPSLNNVMRIVW